MSNEDLVTLLVAKDELISDLQHDLRDGRKCAKRKASTLAVAAATPSNTAVDGDNDAFAIILKRKCHLSAKSSISLVIRRNLTSIAANQMSIMTMRDISGQTLNRYEVDLGACLVVFCRDFHATLENQRSRSPSDLGR